MAAKPPRIKIQERNSGISFPGPGAYGKVDKKLVDGPKFVFGSEKRTRSKSPGDENPGPGQYKIPSKI